MSSPPLTVDDPLFPSYIRMFKYEIMQFFSNKEDHEYYQMMRSVIGDDIVDKALHCLNNPEEILRVLRPDMGIPRLPDQDKVNFRSEETRRKHQEAVAEREMKIEQARQAAIPAFLQESRLLFIQKLLSTREGIKAVDDLLEKYNTILWQLIHLDLNESDWRPATLEMFKKFFKIEINKKEDNTEELLTWSNLDRIGAIINPKPITDYFAPSEVTKESVLSTKTAPPAYRKMADKMKPNKCVNDNHWALAIIRAIPRFTKPDESSALDFLFEEEEETRDSVWKSKKDDELSEMKKEEFLWQFVKACNTNPYNRAALYFILDDDFDSQIRMREDRMRALERADFDMNHKSSEVEETVNDEEEELVKTMRPPADYAKFRDESHFDSKSNIILRDYQQELVQSGIAGKNTIICAPTGSGKTEVAIFIAMQHLDAMKRQEKPARVAMIVPKIPLVEQQKKRFHKYVSGEYYVEGFQGYSSSRINEKETKRRELVLACDITVFTPMVLVNMLRSVRENERLHVCDFSMIIFDEVHHCRQDHPYNELMHIVHDYEGPKPQTLGLSASLLLEKVATRNKNDAIDKIYKLCANVGATRLDSVHKHIEDLMARVPMPIDHITKCDRPDHEKSPFRNTLLSLLKKIEAAVKPKLEKLKKDNSTGVKLSQKNGTFQNAKNSARYRQHIGELSKELMRMKKDDDQELQDAVVATKYLDMIIDAIAINEVMPAKYAFQEMEVLIRELRKLNSGATIREIFFDRWEELERTYLAEEELGYHPIVQELLREIVEQFEKNNDSRVIVFVNTRRSAWQLKFFLSDEFRNNEILRKKVGVSIRAEARTNINGVVYTQSLAESKDTINRFNNGDLKIIVATSVIEEGLDVKSCNLIIKYNVASSVVQRMQKRGRARAVDGRCVLLVLDESLMNEEYQALMSERVMNAAIADIREFGSKNLEQKVEKYMIENKTLRLKDQADRERVNEALKNQSFNILCSICDVFITNSYSIRQLYTNTISLDKNIWARLKIEVGKTSKALYYDEITAHIGHVYCKGHGSGDNGCNTKLGTIMRLDGVYMPILTAAQLKFVETKNGEPITNESVYNTRWASVGNQLFTVKPARKEELVVMLQTFSREYPSQYARLESYVRECDRRADAKAREKAKDIEKRNAQKGDWDEEGDGAELLLPDVEEIAREEQEEKIEWDDKNDDCKITTSSRFQD